MQSTLANCSRFDFFFIYPPALEMISKIFSEPLINTYAGIMNTKRLREGNTTSKASSMLCNVDLGESLRNIFFRKSNTIVTPAKAPATSLA
jgi:hypothetical protein